MRGKTSFVSLTVGSLSLGSGRILISSRSDATGNTQVYAPIRPGTVGATRERRPAEYYLSLVCMHIAYTLIPHPYAPGTVGRCGRRNALAELLGVGLARASVCR